MVSADAMARFKLSHLTLHLPAAIESPC